MEMRITKNALDSKNRLIIPSANRDILPNVDKAVYTYETDINFKVQSLLTYERKYEDLKERLIEALANGKITYEEMQKQLDKYDLSEYARTNIDSQYRITIPEPLLEKYEIYGEVIVARTHDHNKIFANEENLNKYRTL